MRLLFLLCCALALPLFAAERVVTPNWAMASTLTAMGFPPLAMGDKRIYPLWMSDPVQPPSVVDLGERYRPNRELLAQLPLSLVFDNFFIRICARCIRRMCRWWMCCLMAAMRRRSKVGRRM